MPRNGPRRSRDEWSDRGNPFDPIAGHNTPARRRIDVSVILAALVMVTLAVGVIVGVAML